MEELKKLMEEQAKEWASFKAENDRRLKEIEAKGSVKADPLTETKIEKHSAALTTLEDQIKGVMAKLNRPGNEGGEDEAAREHKEHRKLFSGFMRKGGTDATISRMNELQTKLLQVGVDSDGGMAIPESVDASIGKMEIQLAPMLGLVSVMSAGAETYEKLFDLRGTASGWVGEATARPETVGPKFGAFQPRYGELYANPFATQKMLDDAFFDVEAWLASSVAEKFGLDIDAAIVTGAGVNTPRGLLSPTLAATADAARAYGVVEKMNSGVSGSLTTDNLMDLCDKLQLGYRPGATWLMARATKTFIRKLKDSTNQYLWQPGLQAGMPSVLLGYPLVEDENMPAMGAAASSVLLGDLKRAYKFINIRGIRVLRDPYTDKPKVGFYTTQRVGGGVEDTSAYKVLSLQ